MTRILVGLVLGAAGFSVIWWLPADWFGWFVLAVIAVGLVELVRMKIDDAVEKWSIIISSLILAASMIAGLFQNSLVLLLVALMFIISVTIMWRVKTMQEGLEHLGLAAFAFIYMGLATPYWAMLRHMENGRWLVLLAIVATVLSDTFAYFIGKAVGKHKFAAMISPKKTWEGFAASLLGSAVGTGAVVMIGLNWMPLWHAVLIAMAIWIVAPMGDLVESMIKRGAGVKDSGTLLKGHGGVLDRLDAMIFVGPLMFAYAKYMMP